VGNSSPSLKEQFLSLVHCEGDYLDWARAGKLPSLLNEFEIAMLICEGSETGQLRKGSVAGELRLAALRGDMEATQSEFDLWGKKGEQLYCYIHRDNARRYFQRIGLAIPEGSPLWCWLNAKPANAVGKLRQDQRDKADYQQECKRVWGISNALPITGAEGITYHADLIAWRQEGRYEGGTLEKWAREVAPETVRGKRGRPKKSAPAKK
jgi:hypothetical protein